MVSLITLVLSWIVEPDNLKKISSATYMSTALCTAVQHCSHSSNSFNLLLCALSSIRELVNWHNSLFDCFCICKFAHDKNFICSLNVEISSCSFSTVVGTSVTYEKAHFAL